MAATALETEPVLVSSQRRSEELELTADTYRRSTKTFTQPLLRLFNGKSSPPQASASSRPHSLRSGQALRKSMMILRHRRCDRGSHCRRPSLVLRGGALRDARKMCGSSGKGWNSRHD